jgi:Protein of unknown function (DUF4232)
MRRPSPFPKRPSGARALGVAAALGSVAALGIAVSPASGSPASGSPASGSAVTASTPACRSAGLVTWLDTSPNGTAGTIYYTLNFTNLSGSTCTLRGYPGVSAINLKGRQLGRAATRNTGTKVRTITLRNGRTASAYLGIVEAGNFPSSSCRPVTAAGLKVFAPNQAAGKTVPFPFPACSGSPAYLRIEAVK